ncbi:MAG: molybdate ABC transporter substrate-binding protein [Myxococcota bacterium]
MIVLALLACGPERPPESLHVVAASSLTGAFEAIAVVFEAENPGVDVELAFAGSQVHRLQLEQGLEADVFASADPEHVEALVRSGIVARTEGFAHNALVVVVPRATSGVERFEDLGAAERVVIGTEGVPAGRYAREVLERSVDTMPGLRDAVLAHVVSEESNVRLVRAKVELGEADAAFVYKTDALGRDALRVIEIPEPLGVRAEYVMGIVAAGDRALAERWVALVRSDAGQAHLAAHGFGP